MKKLIQAVLIALFTSPLYAAIGDYNISWTKVLGQNIKSFKIDCTINGASPTQTIHKVSDLIDKGVDWQSPNNFCGKAEGDYHISIIATNHVGDSGSSEGADFFVEGGMAYLPRETVPDVPSGDKVNVE